jgi:flagellar basal body-associated protein FliL
MKGMDVISEKDKRKANKQLLIGIPVFLVVLTASFIGVSSWLGDGAGWVAALAIFLIVGAYLFGKGRG